ncbi:MAG: lipoyl(octanoyl) transferase LipB [Polyangiaceae bacterium]
MTFAPDRRPRSFSAHWLGCVPYGKALALQEKLLDERIRGAIGDTILLLEHPPTVTLGRGAKAENVLATRAHLEKIGVEVYETGRGGDVTYHGPGQLVAYPIFDLGPDRCDVRRYVRDLAEVMVGVAGDCGIGASFIEGDPKLVGVWVDEASPQTWPGDPRERAGLGRPAKLGAIGVRLSRWVTMHGFALNVSTDLAGFGLIVPCGIAQYGVTSLVALGVRDVSVAEIARASIAHVARVFDASATMASAAETARLGLG